MERSIGFRDTGPTPAASKQLRRPPVCQRAGTAMRHRSSQAVAVGVLGAVLLVPLVSTGQSSEQGRAAESLPELRRHDDLQPLMDYTAHEIDRMRAQMAKGQMTADAEREMAFEMRALSWILDRMAALFDRPAMKAPERAKELQKLREELEAIKRAHREDAKPAERSGGE